MSYAARAPLFLIVISDSNFTYLFPSGIILFGEILGTLSLKVLSSSEKLLCHCSRAQVKDSSHFPRSYTYFILESCIEAGGSDLSLPLTAWNFYPVSELGLHELGLQYLASASWVKFLLYNLGQECRYTEPQTFQPLLPRMELVEHRAGKDEKCDCLPLQVTFYP